MKSQAAVKTVISSTQDAVESGTLAGLQRNGEPGTWCGTCETYMPSKHMCEWKLLVGVVLCAAVVCVVGMWAILSGRW